MRFYQFKNKPSCCIRNGIGLFKKFTVKFIICSAGSTKTFISVCNCYNILILNICFKRYVTRFTMDNIIHSLLQFDKSAFYLLPGYFVNIEVSVTVRVTLTLQDRRKADICICRPFIRIFESLVYRFPDFNIFYIKSLNYFRSSICIISVKQV